MPGSKLNLDSRRGPTDLQFQFQQILRAHYELDGVSNHRRRNCLLSRCSDTDLSQNQSSASLAFVRGIHQWPPDSRDSNAENVSIWLRHHALCLNASNPNNHQEYMSYQIVGTIPV